MPNQPPVQAQQLSALLTDITAGPQIITLPLPINQGGTGQTTAAGAMNVFGATRTITATSPIQIDAGASATLAADRTISVLTFGAAQAGVVPLSGGGTTNFLRADGSWAAPTAAGIGAVPTTRLINTTAPLTGGGDLSADRTLAITDFAGVGSGAVPSGSGNVATKYLDGTGNWTVPAGGGSINIPAANEIVYSTGSNLAGDPNFVFYASRYQIGLGTSTPSAGLHVVMPQAGSGVGYDGINLTAGKGPNTAGGTAGAGGANTLIAGAGGNASAGGGIAGAGGSVSILAGGSGTNSSSIQSAAGGSITISSGAGTPTGDVTVKSANAPSANINSGSIKISTGSVSGTGTTGNIYLQSNAPGKVAVNHASSTLVGQLDVRNATSGTPTYITDSFLATQQGGTTSLNVFDGDASHPQNNGGPSVYIQRYDNGNSQPRYALQAVVYSAGTSDGVTAVAIGYDAQAAGTVCTQVTGLRGRGYTNSAAGTTCTVLGGDIQANYGASASNAGGQALLVTSSNSTGSNASSTTGQTTSMVGLKVLADGSKKNTAAIEISASAGAAVWQRGITFDASSSDGTGPAIDLSDLGNLGQIYIGQTGNISWKNGSAVAGANIITDVSDNLLLEGDSGKLVVSMSYFMQTKGANVSSGTTITPTGQIFHVTGTTTIQTINVPSGGARTFTGTIYIIPDGIFSWNTSGNIAIGGTSVVSKVLAMTYDGSSWFPSYLS